jgi:hypothetical protein
MDRGIDMSTDPTGLDGKNCIETTKKKYVNIIFTKDQWCSYKGICMKNNLTMSAGVCDHCIYKKGIDVPKIIDAALEAKNNESS